MGSVNTQFQDILAAMMSTIQAEKRETVAAIKETNDRIVKKIFGPRLSK
jgi:hypothetical protein